MVVLFVGLRPKLILGSNNSPTNTRVTNHHGNVKDHDDNKDGADEVHDEDNNQQICTSVTSHHDKDHDKDERLCLEVKIEMTNAMTNTT